MNRYKVETCLFFTDDSIGFYLRSSKPSQSERFDHIELDKGILDNGTIVDPEILLGKLRLLFKSNQIKPRKVRMVINDQNILIRVLDLSKDVLIKTGIPGYLSAEIGKSLIFPFVKTTFLYHVISETTSTVKLLVIASDDRILNDYLDVFDRLKVKKVYFDMPSLALYNLYLTQSDEKFSDLMLITLYDQYFSIKLFEDGIPIFNLTEEFEGTSDLYMDQIENYVERVANYYRFNMQKGTKKIANLLFVNFSNQYDEHSFQTALATKTGLREYHIMLLPIASGSNTLTHSNQMAYASGVEKSSWFKMVRTLDFQLSRPDQTQRKAHYLLTLAFAIFSIISLIYIPLHTTNEDILIQQNLISNLERQLEVLETESNGLATIGQKEKDYSDAFDTLSEQEFSVTSHLEDLFGLVPDGLQIVSYQIDAETKTIVFVLSIVEIADLNEYLLDIFETFGLSNDPLATGRWMTAVPEQTNLSALVIEVTVHYA